MSRRPTPTALKALAGNPGHRPLNDLEPKPVAAEPEMPKGMAKAAQREWENIVPILVRMGLMTVVDGKAIAAYCDAYAMWEEARRDLRKNGLVLDSPVLDKENQPIYIDEKLLLVRKQNPAFSVYNASAKLMKSFLIEFGLTPASRTKLKVSPPKEPNAMQTFLDKGTAEAKAAAPLAFDTGKAKPGMPDLSAASVAARIPASATNFDA